MQYFKNNPSPFQFKTGSEPPQKKPKADETNHVSELELCEASFNLLSSAPEHFIELWDWSCFITKFSNHTNPEIRWIVCQSVAKLNGMSESDKLKLVMQSVTEEENRIFSLKYFVKEVEKVAKQSLSTLKNEVIDCHSNFENFKKKKIKFFITEIPDRNQQKFIVQNNR